jgi:hypothetical protein
MSICKDIYVYIYILDSAYDIDLNPIYIFFYDYYVRKYVIYVDIKGCIYIYIYILDFAYDIDLNPI